MNLKQAYLLAHKNLSDFLKPITDVNCNPCKHNRGPYGCCHSGPYLVTDIEKELNKDCKPVHNSDHCCQYLQVGIGCSLKHKSGICLSYICGALHRVMTQKQVDNYWKLREKLNNAIAKLEPLNKE
jgi:hypothetical protein